MGKNSSVYFSDQTMEKIDSIMKEWERQDIEDNCNYKRSRSDVIAYSIHVLYDVEILKKAELKYK